MAPAEGLAANGSSLPSFSAPCCSFMPPLDPHVALVGLGDQPVMVGIPWSAVNVTWQWKIHRKNT